MACSPYEPYFNNYQLKKIEVCLSYVQALWGYADPNGVSNIFLLNKITQNSTIFDGCGFKNPGYLDTPGNQSYIKPSSFFQNATDFMNRIGIPFFDNYTFTIYDDTIIA